MTSFVLTVVGISLSGAMAPGPITAATLAAGARNRHAGALVCLGHVAVELPLILLLGLGLGAVLQSQSVRMGIGVVGGAFLVFVGLQLLASLRRTQSVTDDSVERHPFWIGVVLSAANPYFVVWWATVGLSLITLAADSGVLGLVLLALIHWTCDLGWLEVLSLAGFKSSEAFGLRAQKVVALICGAALLAFGVKFLCDALIGR